MPNNSFQHPRFGGAEAAEGTEEAADAAPAAAATEA